MRPIASVLTASFAAGVVWRWLTRTHTDVEKEPLYVRTAQVAVTGLTFHPNGKQLVTVSALPDRDGYFQKSAIQFWDLSTLSPTNSLVSGENGYTSVRYNTDGSLLAVGSDNKFVKVLETSAHETLATIDVKYNNPRLFFTPDGRFLISLATKSILLWDTHTFEIAHTIHSQGGTFFNDIDLSPDGRYLAVGDFKKRVFIYDMQTGDIVTSLQQEDTINQLLFLDSAHILIRGADIRLWNIKVGEPITELAQNPLIRGMSKRPHSLDFVVTRGDKSIVLWHPFQTAITVVDEIAHQMGLFSCIACSDDGTMVAAATANHEVAIWKL